MEHVAGEIGAQQDEADLRAVAVGDHDAVARGDERGDVVGRFAGRLVLVGHGDFLAVEDEGIAADGDDRERTFHGGDSGVRNCGGIRRRRSRSRAWGSCRFRRGAEKTISARRRSR